MEKPESLIGRKIKGFKFESATMCDINYLPKMDGYIGKQGEIDLYHEKIKAFVVKFDDAAFFYPASLIEAHLIPEETNSPIKAMTKLKDNSLTDKIREILDGKKQGKWIFECLNKNGSKCEKMCEGFCYEFSNLTAQIQILCEEYHSQQSWADQKELVELKRKLEEQEQESKNHFEAAKRMGEQLSAEQEKSAKLVEIVKASNRALEYAAFNYDGSKLEHLQEGIIDSTGVSDTCLMQVRTNLEALKDYEQK